MALLDKSYEQIKYELDIDGYSRVVPSSGFTAPLLASLLPRFQCLQQLTESCPNEYHTQVFRDHDLLNKANEDINNYRHFCRKLVAEMDFPEKEFDSIYATYDDRSSKNSAQSPHFDRIPTLKFMLYANTLDITNGAFCLSNGSHHWTRKMFPFPRKSFNSPGFKELSRDIPSYITQRIIPVEGRAGTIIIFHTDCIHNQGLVSNGSTKILRAHFRLPKAKSPEKIFKIATF